MNKLINISMTIGILFFIGMEIIKNLSSETKTKLTTTWKKIFLKLPLSTQMAIVSFGIGSLLFVLYFPFKESDNLIKIGIIYVVIALVANGLMLIKLIYDCFVLPVERLNIIKQILILLINVPISFFYFIVILYTVLSNQPF